MKKKSFIVGVIGAIILSLLSITVFASQPPSTPPINLNEYYLSPFQLVPDFVKTYGVPWHLIKVNGDIWVSVQNFRNPNVIRISPDGKIQTYLLKYNNVEHSQLTFAVNGKGELYAGDYKSVYQYAQHDDTFIRIGVPEEILSKSDKPSDDISINSITFDSRGILWIVSNSRKVFTFSPRTDQWTEPVSLIDKSDAPENYWNGYYHGRCYYPVGLFEDLSGKLTAVFQCSEPRYADGKDIGKINHQIVYPAGSGADFERGPLSGFWKIDSHLFFTGTGRYDAQKVQILMDNKPLITITDNLDASWAVVKNSGEYIVFDREKAFSVSKDGTIQSTVEYKTYIPDYPFSFVFNGVVPWEKGFVFASSEGLWQLQPKTSAQYVIDGERKKLAEIRAQAVEGKYSQIIYNDLINQIDEQRIEADDRYKDTPYLSRKIFALQTLQNDVQKIVGTLMEHTLISAIKYDRDNEEFKDTMYVLDAAPELLPVAKTLLEKYNIPFLQEALDGKPIPEKEDWWDQANAIDTSKSQGEEKGELLKQITQLYEKDVLYQRGWGKGSVFAERVIATAAEVAELLNTTIDEIIDSCTIEHIIGLQIYSFGWYANNLNSSNILAQEKNYDKLDELVNFFGKYQSFATAKQLQSIEVAKTWWAKNKETYKAAVDSQPGTLYDFPFNPMTNP